MTRSMMAVACVAMITATTLSSAQAEAAGKPKISCEEGTSIVENSGFVNVRPRKCEGKTFSYLAIRSPGIYIVYLNSITGKIRYIRRTWIKL